VQARQVIFAQVHAVEQYLAVGWVVEPRQQLDQCCLACTVETDQSDALAGLDVKIDVAQHEGVGSGIGERDVAEFDSLADRFRCDEAVLRLGQDRLQFQVVEQVVEVQVALIKSVQTSEQREDRVLRLPEDPQKHGHVTQGDPARNCAQDDPCIAAVVSQVGDQAPAQTCYRAPLGDRKVLHVELRE